MLCLGVIVFCRDWAVWMLRARGMFWGSFFQGVSGEHVVIVCSDSSASGFHCTSHEMRGVLGCPRKLVNG